MTTTSWNTLKLLFQLVFHPGKDGRHSLCALCWLERCEFIVRSTCTQDARKVWAGSRSTQRHQTGWPQKYSLQRQCSRLKPALPWTSPPDSTTLDLDSQTRHDKAATSKYLVGSVTNCSQACAVGDFVPSCSQVHGVTFCACAFWAISSLSFSAAPDLVTRSYSRTTWARHSLSPLTHPLLSPFASSAAGMTGSGVFAGIFELGDDLPEVHEDPDCWYRFRSHIADGRGGHG